MNVNWRIFPDEKPTTTGEYLVRGIGGLNNKLHHWVCLWVGEHEDSAIANRFFYGGNDDLRLTPSLDLGLVLFAGQFKIDDGSPRGSTVYQNPPVDFVIGGSSDMFIGGGAPKIGVGATFVKGLDGDPQWISHVDLGYFSYDGSTKPFTSSGHREKELDISMFSIGAETGFVLPLSDSLALTGGLRLQFLSLEGEIRSKQKDTAKIIAARERFDKSVDFSMTTAMVYLGLTY